MIENIKNKKGISVVIGVLILIAMVFVLVAIVYSVVLPMVEDNLAYAEACSVNILDKIEINSMNTCYHKATRGINISINIRDIAMDELLISVSTDSESGSITLDDSEDIKPNSGRLHPLKLEENFGLSTGDAESIRIAPVINGKQCSEVDSLYSIPACT